MKLFSIPQLCYIFCSYVWNYAQFFGWHLQYKTDFFERWTKLQDLKSMLQGAQRYLWEQIQDMISLLERALFPRLASVAHFLALRICCVSSCISAALNIRIFGVIHPAHISPALSIRCLFKALSNGTHSAFPQRLACVAYYWRSYSHCVFPQQ